jgi:hypothetical protein
MFGKTVALEANDGHFARICSSKMQHDGGAGQRRCLDQSRPSSQTSTAALLVRVVTVDSEMSEIKRQRLPRRSPPAPHIPVRRLTSRSRIWCSACRASWLADGEFAKLHRIDPRSWPPYCGRKRDGRTQIFFFRHASKRGSSRQI